MATKNPKRLVIDASVLASAGEKGRIPATRCQEFLMEVLDQGHLVVITPAIETEWNRHSKSFAVLWRAAMKDKGLAVRLKTPELNWLQEAVEALDPNDGRNIAAKDLLLMEAAICTDRIVISRDTKAGKVYCRLCDQLKELGTVIWLEPAKAGKTAILWLRSGAPPEPTWYLSHLEDGA